MHFLFVVALLWGTAQAAAPLRWGIAGSGRISNDFVTAVSILPRTEHQVTTVASRKLADAQKFAQEHKIPQALEGYLPLAQSKEVDVVYVGVITAFHYDVAKLMLENGKHVLVEKALASNAKQAAALIKLSKEKNLFLMEAIWARTFPVYDELRGILNRGELGQIKQVVLTFSTPMSGYRFHNAELKASALLDIGIYPLQMQQLVFQQAKPRKVVALGNVSKVGVDLSVYAVLEYEGGKHASIVTGSEFNLPAMAIISGTNGTVKIPDFRSPTKLIKNDVEQNFPMIKNDSKFNFGALSAGLAYEAQEVRKCIQEGKLESAKITHAESLQLAEIIDDIRKQIGAIDF